ncbi:restriction endonuclease subunit S [Spirosoma foliorum]|uniref:Restriction endonuclease subunit S n=1 Tax=Spirosoma foliorum TaxID=2710596 RepID=A0A7G5GQ94_9BACT|nr:restriction endonuclease subunit S [Spirosoma foliorum]QMW01036.1 restriction endonuclease subunit S [Spirosoma foliorum]
MKTDWEVKTLGNVIQKTENINPAQSPDKEFDYIDVSSVDNETFSIVSTSRLTGKEAPSRARKLVRTNDIIFATVRPTLKRIAIIPDKFNGQVCSTGYFVLRANEYIDYKLIFYFLQTDGFNAEMQKLQKGASYPAVTDGEVRGQTISYPKSLPEQQRIVAILDEAFAAIDKAKENAEKNLQNARELFESYLQSVFANPGEEWVEKSLGEVCSISSKLIDPRNTEFLNVLHVGGANIESLTGRLIELKTAQEEGLISGKFLFDESMVLYSKIRPYLMKVAKPDFCGLCSADIYPLSPFKDKMIRDYLFYLLLSHDFTQYAIKGSARAGMPKVNREHLFEYKFYIGSITDQTSIVAKLDALSAETKKLEAIYQQKLTDLDELKKAILQKAFQGELTNTAATALAL